MNTEDQYIKQFLNAHPTEKAPSDFTQKVMTSVLANPTASKSMITEGWLYFMVASTAIFTGFVIYLIFSKQSLFDSLLKLKGYFYTDFNFSSWSFASSALPDNFSIAPMWIGVLLIPILLLTLDKLLRVRNTKTNMFFV